MSQSLTSGPFYLRSWNPKYTKEMHKRAPKMVPPEERLKPLLIAAPLLAVAFFWYVPGAAILMRRPP